MTKIFNKLLLIGVSTCLLSSLAFAQDTICYKNNVEKPSLIEDVSLDGGICNSKFSLNQMKNNGWDILDIKIISSQNKIIVLKYYKNLIMVRMILDENYLHVFNYYFFYIFTRRLCYY